MKYWTIQKKSIIERAYKEGVFYPDFRYSPFLAEDPKRKELYDLILESYNRINDMNLSGLIFTFMKVEGEGIYQINNFSEFKSFMKQKKNVIYSLWKSLNDEEHVIVELECDQTFNPLFIDINDFQFLMPPVMVLPPYTRQSINRIVTDIKLGEITYSEFPSNVIQAHLPCIKEEHIVRTYPMFDIDE